LPELASFFRERGIDFVLMSEHVETLTAETIGSFIADCAALSDDSFLLVPGIEIDALHALFYGVAAVNPWSCNEELAAQLVANGAMAVVSHPVKIRGRLPAIIERQAEGVEVWNSRHDGKAALRHCILEYWRNLQAVLSRKLSPVCGIDFHSRSDFVPLVLELDCETLDKGSILTAIRGKRFHISHAGKRLPLDFDSGALPRRYRLYSSVYRAAYHVVYSIHRAAVASGIKLPPSLKARLRNVF
jgi:hypothetical protein